MGVTSYSTTQYYVECDACGIADTVADNRVEGVRSKQEAIRWAGMHRIKDGRVLCDECYNKYKKELKNNDCCS